MPTPESSIATPGISTSGDFEYMKLSQTLLAAFPSQNDIDILCKSDYQATYYFHKIMTNADHGLDHEAYNFVDELAQIPSPSTHPVMIAKRMLIFASFLQYFPPHTVAELSEPASIVIKRLTDAAIQLVTTNDDLVDCMEGLECIVLEACFQANAGNLRRSWYALRRAMLTAQIMKLDKENQSPRRIDPRTTVDPKFMWLRLVIIDRFLSLMLGLAEGNPGKLSYENLSAADPRTQLEFMQAEIIGHLIRRNATDPLAQDVRTTQDLDAQLLRVAKSMPEEFWHPPNFSILEMNSQDDFSETRRLGYQLHHFNLVHLLHLPYLLSSNGHSYDKYAKFTCINASREILSRFVDFRNFHKFTTCCRTGDLFALMAGITILISHIDGHRNPNPTENLLAHQRLSDRAIVEHVVANMNEVAMNSDDKLLGRNADILKGLLKCERAAVDDDSYTASSALCCLEQEFNALQTPISYFGMAKVPLHVDNIPLPVNTSNDVFSFAGPRQPSSNGLLPMQSQLSYLPADQQTLHPSLTDTMQDPMFQGVDAMFFDGVTRAGWL
ncbi:hypothetical protein BT63DRAFT_54739 [Microthyrium microscopicum]|uniref:Transcription factor domain-containing protein n=1 Tax=Microthyrium microscopicum TaxID=703497 RepID=A0A6A6U2X0_9PEZI|nr:hypothetical protein BT63DRAFT_54739 [Microthyrium microscopicum]